MSKQKLEKIVEQAIEGNELPFDNFLQELFKKLHPQLFALIGSSHDIEDIYIRSMQKFWERFVIQQEKLPKNSAGYIFQMCKNTWLMSKRHPWNTVILKDELQDRDTLNAQNKTTVNQIQDLEEEWLQKRALSKALEELSPKCKILIESEIDASIKLKDLQHELGYKNYQSLVQAKYNCKKRLIKKVYEIYNQLIAFK